MGTSIKKFLKENSYTIRIVQYVLIALFVILIVLDIYLALDSKDGNTISEVIQNSAINYYYILMYLWGAIAANLFLYSKKPTIFNGTIGFIIVLLIGALLEIFNIKSLLGLHENHQYSIAIYTAFMLFGLLIGWLFWRQKLTEEA